MREWMVYDPYDGESFFATEAEAVDAASGAIDGFLADDGWDGDVARIVVARVAYTCDEKVLGRRADMSEAEWDVLTHGEGDEAQEWLAFSMQPVDGEDIQSSTACPTTPCSNSPPARRAGRPPLRLLWVGLPVLLHLAPRRPVCRPERNDR